MGTAVRTALTRVARPAGCNRDAFHPRRRQAILSMSEMRPPLVFFTDKDSPRYLQGNSATLQQKLAAPRYILHRSSDPKVLVVELKGIEPYGHSCWTKKLNGQSTWLHRRALDLWLWSDARVQMVRRPTGQSGLIPTRVDPLLYFPGRSTLPGHCVRARPRPAPTRWWPGSTAEDPVTVPTTS